MRYIIQLRHFFLTLTCGVICLVLALPAFAEKKQFDRIVSFGTSLSDSGNAFIMLSDPSAFGFNDDCSMGTPVNVPPYDQLDDFLVPDGSYARGGHHVTNGATWIEGLAKNLGLAGNAQPVFRSSGRKASNYAVGGARILDFDCRFNLIDQLEVFSADFPDRVSSRTLFVIEMGSNDIRDIMVNYDPGNPFTSIINLNVALGGLEDTITMLYGKGARKFLLVNIPPIGETPAVSILEQIIPGAAYLANSLANYFNFELDVMLDKLNNDLEGADIRLLDIYALVSEIIDNPKAFNIVNTEDACVTPGIPPFTCKKPDTYLFWDGIHPTKAVHAIVAKRAKMTLGQ